MPQRIGRFDSFALPEAAWDLLWPSSFRQIEDDPDIYVPSRLLDPSLASAELRSRMTATPSSPLVLE